jgi:ABC-2 type transport system permease protein
MQPKRQSLVQLAILLAILVLANVVASKIYTRFDLTKEKRFTLTQPTRDMLRNLDDVVYVKVYLEGEFPAGFKRLRNSTLEMLNAFKAYSDTEIQYEFIDPMASPDQKEREAIAKQLMDKGLEPTRLVENQEGYSEKLFFRVPLLATKDAKCPLCCYNNKPTRDPKKP